MILDYPGNEQRMISWAEEDPLIDSWTDYVGQHGRMERTPVTLRTTALGLKE
jgi:hypothetical protein